MGFWGRANPACRICATHRKMHRANVGGRARVMRKGLDVGVRFCPVEAFGATYRKLHIKNPWHKNPWRKKYHPVRKPPPQKTKSLEKIIRVVAQNLQACMLWWILPCVYRGVGVFKNLWGLFGFWRQAHLAFWSGCGDCPVRFGADYP